MGHPHTRMTGAPWRNDKNGNFCANPDFLDTLKFVWCGPGGGVGTNDGGSARCASRKEGA